MLTVAPGQPDSASQLWLKEFLAASEYDYASWKESTFLRTYREVYVDPDHIFLAPQEQDLISGQRRFEQYSVTSAVQSFSPIIVLGEPGAGKTTALRELSRRYRERYQNPDDLLPLFVPIVPLDPLPVSDSSIVEGLIRRAMAQLVPTASYPPHELWRLLRQRKFVLLFDGLNEIPEHLIAPYCESFVEFIRRQRDGDSTRIVIASRVDNLTRHRLAVRKISRHVFEVQKLTSDERIREFAGGYLDGDLLDAFVSELRTTTGAEHMAENRLLLAAMALVFERDRRLPSNRAHLLRLMAVRLLTDYGPGGATREGIAVELATLDPTIQMQHAILQHVALSLRQRRLGLGAPADTFVQIVQEAIGRLSPALRLSGPGDAPEIVDLFIRRHILARAHPGYRFWLEVMQEYFAASEVAMLITNAHGPSGPDAKAAREQVDRYCREGDWMQTLAIAAGLIEAKIAGTFVGTVTRRHPVLAATCLAGNPAVDSSPLTRHAESRLFFFVSASSVSKVAQVALSVLPLVAIVVWRREIAGTVSGLRAWVTYLEALTSIPRLAWAAVVIGILVAVSALTPTYCFRFIDWAIDALLNRALPDRYVQPLLRSLVTLGTPQSARLLSALELNCSRRHDVSPRLQSYVTHANRVWRFRTETPTTLIRMLQQLDLVDYAIDRLSQIGNVSAIEPLLHACGRLPARSAESAVRVASRLARDADQVLADRAKADLRSLLAAVRTAPVRVRRAAYEGLLSLGESPETLDRPWHLDPFITRKRLQVVVDRAFPFMRVVYRIARLLIQFFGS